MKPFRIAIQFLTRIPVGNLNDITPEQQGESLLYYPLVGFLIGAILYGILYVTQPISDFISAGITLTVWVLLTGGLHLDGLADSADAWLGGTKGDKNEIKVRSIEIMKDPNCGPAGVFWIVIVLMLKFSALIEMSQSNIYVILLVPVIGRGMAVLLFLTTPYISKYGIASKLAEHIPLKMAYVMLINVALIIIVTNLYGTFIIIAIVFVMILLRQIMINRLDGMTGDTAGALIEITESVSLVMYILVLNLTQ
ncbi:MAG: adenosylcobinamide-GDP ribazoletransferase [Gammaproteobacteria bacterium]